MNTARNAKFFMSICVCIQLLKIIKFTNVIVPKMSLMTSVLSKGCYDLVFFGVIFGISMFAFCMLFYIQARHAMHMCDASLRASLAHLPLFHIWAARLLHGRFLLTAVVTHRPRQGALRRLSF